MKSIRFRVVTLLSSLLLMAAPTYAVTNPSGIADRNYQVIVERNPFGIKPPPPPAPPPTNAPANKDEILLTGITSIGSPRAYFMTKAPQAKQPEYFDLGIDQAQHGVEVIEIDPTAKSVKVKQGGVESVMTFAANGVKPPATPAAGTPGAPGALPGAPAMPGVATPNPAIPGMQPPGMAGFPGAASAATTTPSAGRVRTIPSRAVRTPGADLGGGMVAPGAAQPAGRPDPNAPIQDALMMELQRRANPNITFPPTPMPPQ
jgi:hypothetical protein